MYRDEITDATILDECKNFRDALRMSWRRSGLTIEEVAIKLLPRNAGLNDVTNLTKNISRIINPHRPEDKRNMDGDLLIPFMVATGNSIPLRWLFLKYDTPPSIVTNEELMTKIDSLQDLFVSTLRNIHQSARRARAKGLTVARMSLAAVAIPAWLTSDAMEIGRFNYV